MASTSLLDTRLADDPPSRAELLPTELLRQIFVLSLVDYLDDLIDGPLKLRAAQGTISRDVEFAQDVADLPPDVIDPATNAPNPILTLLRTSYQIRAVTLKVISEVLGIPIEEGLITRCVAVHHRASPA